MVLKCFYIFALALALAINGYAQTTVEFDTLSIDCLEYKIKEEVIIIKTRKEYEDLNLYRKGNCRPLPEIDFDKNVLIGYNIETSGCRPPTCSMVFSKNGDQYTGYATIRVQGICRALFREIYWFTIEVPHDQNFTIEIKSQKLMK